MRRGHSRGTWRNPSPRPFRPHGGSHGFQRSHNSGPNRYPAPFQTRSQYRLINTPRPLCQNRGPNNDIHSQNVRPKRYWNNDFNNHNNHRQNSYSHSQRGPHMSQNIQEQFNKCFSSTESEQSSTLAHNDGHSKDHFNRYDPYRKCTSANIHQLSPENIHQNQVFRRKSTNDCTKVHSDNYGVRPHASDYYERNSTSDDSKTFSQSVDDTVNIVRQRLVNRRHSSKSTTNLSETSSQPYDCDSISNSGTIEYEKRQDDPEPYAKRKTNKHKHQILKSNCNKIKNKIMNQIFKMDKDAIHKLMDNPNSSTKFEYAMDSLITESQNSYNRHARAAAEKTLYSGNDQSIYVENNTLYEDTFMKQMQCVFDPQDTIFFSGLKPIFLSEINKVLQFDEFDQSNINGNDEDPHLQNEDNIYNSMHGDYVANEVYDEYWEQKPQLEEAVSSSTHNYEQKYFDTDLRYDSSASRHFEDQNTSKETDQFQEKCTETKRDYKREKRMSADKRHNSNQSQLNDPTFSLFYGDLDALSGDDDPFAELDKQYHVAVDPSFIKIDEPLFTTNSCNETEENISNKICEDKKPSIDENCIVITDEDSSVNADTDTTKNSFAIKDCTVDIHRINSSTELPNDKSESVEQTKLKQNHVQEKKSLKIQIDSAHKRPAEEQPTHRKKRIKSESDKSDTKVQIVANQNNNDISMNSKQNNKLKPKPDSEKTEKLNKLKIQVKKEFKKQKSKEDLKCPVPPKSSGTNQSILSPNENQSPSKVENKNKLKTFDMFQEKQRKIQFHQFPRNTAIDVEKLTQSLQKKPLNDIAVKAASNKKSVSTQVQRKVKTKDTQTETMSSPKVQHQATQTNVFPEINLSAVDSNERMKQIDLEIQKLLKEKFELYNSLELTDPSGSNQSTLGVTVLTPLEDTKSELPDEIIVEDEIIANIEDIANLPEEELEKLALDDIQNDDTDVVTDYIPVHIINKEEITLLNKESNLSTDNKVKSVTKPVKRTLKTKSHRKDSPISRPNKAKKKKHVKRQKITSRNSSCEDFIPVNKLTVSPIKTRSRRNFESNFDAPLSSIVGNYHQYIKPCSVKLIQYNIDDLLRNFNKTQKSILILPSSVKVLDSAQDCETAVEIVQDTEHFQVDLIDISEDIIIESICEVSENMEQEDTVVVVDEVVDNSEPLPQKAEPEADKCLIFDFYGSDALQKEVVTVRHNTDAVLAIESYKENFLGACANGNVYYFDSSGKLLKTLRGSNFAITCLSVVEDSHGTTVYTGSLDSRIRYYDLETGKEKGPECNVLNPIQTMDRAWGAIFVGTRTGYVMQFECKNNMLIPVSKRQFSDQSILALRALKEGPRKVLLIAGRSENVTIKDAETGLLLRTLFGPVMTVYALLYEDGKVYCGTNSNQIQIFDYASGSYLGDFSGARRAVCLAEYRGLLMAGGYDGCVYVFQSRQQSPAAVLKGPAAIMQAISVFNNKIVVSYNNGDVYVWNIPAQIQVMCM